MMSIEVHQEVTHVNLLTDADAGTTTWPGGTVILGRDRLEI